jgi:hypothetical protein
LFQCHMCYDVLHLAHNILHQVAVWLPVTAVMMT